jgi:SAM-dependent methyltransferase
VRSSIEKTNDAIESVRRDKADIRHLDRLGASLSAVRLELSAAVGESAALASGALQHFRNEVQSKVDSVAPSRAFQAAITAFRAEMIAALENSSGAAKTALLDSVANIDAKFESLRQSTVDQAAVAALRLELGISVEESTAAANGALQAFKNELESILHALGKSKADQADITRLRSEMIAALENSSGAAMAVLIESVANTDRKLESLEQAKADQLSIGNLRLEAKDALEKVSGTLTGRLDQLVAERAKCAVADGVKVEANLAFTAKQGTAIDSLTSALAFVNSQAHDLKRNVLDQERRVGLLLEEARKRFPKPIAAAQIGAMLAEEDHRLDAMYASLEDQFRGTRTDIRQRQAIYLPYVREAKAGTARAPVVDIGCGRGEWLELLRDEGFAARGVDLNRIFLDGCRELGLDVCEQDALSFLRQLKRDSIGLLTSFHVIEHLDHKVLIALLDETLRVLRPGGIAIFETPNPMNVVVGSCNFYLDPTHKRPLPPDLSRYLLEARGFSKVEVLDLHPCREEQMISEGARQVRDALNHMLHSFQDYAVIGRKA